MKFIPLLFFFAIAIDAFGQNLELHQQVDRWRIQPDGSIEWQIDSRIPHSDHIEMSGQKVSLWMQDGVDRNRKPVLNRTIVFPTFRLLPVRTIAHMMYDVKDAELPHIIIRCLRCFMAGRLSRESNFDSS